LQKTDFEAAVAQFRVALKLEPARASLHHDLALALKLKDDLPGAIAEWREAIRLDPQLADAHYSLGVTLWQSGDFADAAEELRQAIQVQPNYAEAYYTLGTVLKQMNQLPEAAEALRQAIRLDPDFAGAHTTLASVLRQLGDGAGAAAEGKAGAEMTKAKTDLQAATFATNSGRRLLSAGDLDGAISQFRTAIRVEPSYAVAHYELGLALSQKGAKEEADGEYRKAAQLDPHLIPPGTSAP
jgi:tetratricopeptide (TPR) repeat protein